MGTFLFLSVEEVWDGQLRPKRYHEKSFYYHNMLPVEWVFSARVKDRSVKTTLEYIVDFKDTASDGDFGHPTFKIFVGHSSIGAEMLLL
ncbi:hypothetical protein K7432_014358 [Basidiobolus ranarum]|uniref:Uncharacterized protein n=1 Tax=Basidiobolus ranarum TaxID=34480 RepID=A0ABR2WHS0_9FUNG